ncbi:hypothetical protein ACFU5O_28075 [Streptomyces sp. NPDC057445]|uniref:hypothetical protein n=1 Tax=Streptomyces sp. NPDC057445 TaxID=3346136 RepID=UPI0036C37BEE
MHLATQADCLRRRLAQITAVVLLAGAAVVVGPSAPEAKAAPPNPLSPCNLPGGKYVCDKAQKGAEWLYENTPGVEGVAGAVDAASTAVDFATDPLGYIEAKLRSGSKGMLEAFGEELTGKKPTAPKGKKKAEKAEGD